MINFTHKLFSLGLCAVAVMPATAQVHSREAAPAKAASLTTSVLSCATKDVKPGHFQLLSVAAKADAELPYSQYGEVVEIINEDFSKMTTGSVADPDTDTDISYENTENAWINMKGDYTQEFGWGSHGAYPAGGCLYIEDGQVNTPMLDLSKNDQMFLVQFDAFTQSAGQTSVYTVIEAAETNNMGPSWDILGSNLVPPITSEKQTFTYLFYGAGPTTLINICPQDIAIFVDNIRVYQIAQTVGTPTAARHRYYHGEDFNLVWNKANNAESYLLNVFTVDDNGDSIFLLQDFDTQSSDTTYTVRGAESGQVYYYTVQGKKGDKVSMPSEQFEVYDVATPVLNEVTITDEPKYTATWNAVPSAERYNYTALYRRVADQDGTFTVTDFSFPGMQYNEGTQIDGEQAVPSYTVANADYHAFTEAVLEDLPQAGWTARNYAVYKDALVIDGFYYYANKETCSLESPEFDLSKNGGEFTVSTRLCSEYLQSYNAYPRSIIALFNYDEEADDFVQTETWYISDLNGSWKDYTHTFTQGSDRSIVSVFAVYAPGNLYLENLKLTQDYKSGDNFLDPFFSKQYVEGESITVPVYKYRKIHGSDVYHTIQAVRTPESQNQYASSYKRVYSDWSTPSLVTANINGIQKTSLNSTRHASLAVEGNSVVVNNPNGEAVTVYGVDGTQVFGNASGDAKVVVPMPQSGTYVFKVGKQSIKFTL